jgi:hypothetical protein
VRHGLQGGTRGNGTSDDVPQRVEEWDALRRSASLVRIKRAPMAHARLRSSQSVVVFRRNGLLSQNPYSPFDRVRTLSVAPVLRRAQTHTRCPEVSRRHQARARIPPPYDGHGSGSDRSHDRSECWLDPYALRRIKSDHWNERTWVRSIQSQYCRARRRRTDSPNDRRPPSCRMVPGSVTLWSDDRTAKRPA